MIKVNKHQINNKKNDKSLPKTTEFKKVNLIGFS